MIAWRALVLLMLACEVVAAWIPTALPVTSPKASSRTQISVMQTMQAQQIEVGQPLPNLEGLGVEVVTDDCAMMDECKTIDEEDLLTRGKTVLVGMPGAFTPTCTDEHLPGFIRNARKFRRLGVTQVAVVTTNDRFIMTAWKRAMRKCTEQEGLKTMDTEMAMLADQDGNLIRALGLAYAESLDRKEKNAFIQLNAGVRSKRFALVVDEGVVTHVAVDEGSIDLDVTSAEALLAVLGRSSGDGGDRPPSGIDIDAVARSLQERLGLPDGTANAPIALAALLIGALSLNAVAPLFSGPTI